MSCGAGIQLGWLLHSMLTHYSLLIYCLSPPYPPIHWKWKVTEAYVYVRDISSVMNDM